MIRARAAVVVVCVLALWPAVAAAPSVAAQSPPVCEPGAMPYAGLPGAALTPEVHTSADAEPVHYVRWRGTVPGFDGMPFSVDVTMPCGATAPLPTVVMAHGFTDDKTIWQETGRSNTVGSEFRRGSNSRWNNIWFASAGTPS